MLSTEEDRELTAVGPGTPAGTLMRRFWHPIAASTEREGPFVKPVRLLGERLVLFRDRRGRLGLVEEACAHRGMSLAYGIPEKNGLRCSYHGWRYNTSGRCVERPDEPLQDDGGPIAIRAYPVEELGSLVFAYLGPGPAPLLPRYNVLVWPDAMGEVDGSVIPCNWLQVMENLLDPVHVAWLHGRFFAHVLERKGGDQLQEFLTRFAPSPTRKIAMDVFEDGLILRHAARSDQEPSWRRGEALFFPATWLITPNDARGSLIFIVPLDDTHTWFLLEVMQRTGQKHAHRPEFPFFDISGADASGGFLLDRAHGQDYAAVVTQGESTRRDLEHLGASDLGLIVYRDILRQQVRLVLDEGEPMNVRRTPARNRIIGQPLVEAGQREHRWQVGTMP